MTKSSIHIICCIARLIISCLILIETIKSIQLIKEGFEFGPMELESTNLLVAFTLRIEAREHVLERNMTSVAIQDDRMYLRRFPGKINYWTKRKKNIKIKYDLEIKCL